MWLSSPISGLLKFPVLLVELKPREKEVTSVMERNTCVCKCTPTLSVLKTRNSINLRQQKGQAVLFLL